MFNQLARNPIIHKLFFCPTFWNLKAFFKCPECGKKYRCYWDGNDVAGHGIDYCGPCAAQLSIKRDDTGEQK